ncbi:MAG: serine hydrolase domain-containing protein [Eubacteriales bacterium]
MNKKKKIVSIIRIVIISFAIICIIGFPPWDGLWAMMAPLPDTIQEQVDKSTNFGLDGIIVYIDEAGQPPAFYTAGWKDRDNLIPADPESYFKIGSINKLYIASAATMMVNDNLISLDDKLTDYFPELLDRIEYADQITIRMMVQHRSGLLNYTDQPGFRWDESAKNSEESLGLIFDKPAAFAPNEEYAYSNTNYLLLGLILDEALGYSHNEYIKENILTPLGLENTYFSLSEVDINDVMSGYYVGSEDDFKEVEMGMVATAKDVGIFIRALNDGTLFNDNEQEIYSSIYEYGHTGWVLGYYSIAYYHEDIDTVVVQFVNTNGGTPIIDLFDTQGGTKVMVANTIYNRILRILRK